LFVARRSRTFGPISPRVLGERVLAIGSEKFHQLSPLHVGEAGANAYVLQRARVVEQTEQERADQILVALLVPTKASHHAVTVAFVLYLQHHPLVGLVGAVARLRHHSVQAGAFEAREPIGGHDRVGGSGRQVQGRSARLQDLFQLLAPLGERHGAEVSLAQRQQIEEHQRSRDFAGQELHA
jgi:hypothetical protein